MSSERKVAVIYGAAARSAARSQRLSRVKEPTFFSPGATGRGSKMSPEKLSLLEDTLRRQRLMRSTNMPWIGSCSP